MANIDHPFWAREMLSHLIRRIRQFQGGDKFITYGELARTINYPEPHSGNLFSSNIGKSLGVMGHFFDDMSVDGQKIPLIQALVVNQGQKLPSDGLKEFTPQYPYLPVDKKRDFVRNEYRRIFEFGTRWEVVLDHFGLRGESHPNDTQREHTLPKRHNPYGSEGSPEHITLRDYLVINPSIVGIPEDTLGIPEYALKSGDSVDVVFITDREIIAVEVKSFRSGTDDLERGLYQCVKYQAVLNAEAKINRTGLIARSLLVISSELPRRLVIVKNRLNLQVLEEIRPKNGQERTGYG